MELKAPADWIRIRLFLCVSEARRERSVDNWCIFQYMNVLRENPKPGRARNIVNNIIISFMTSNDNSLAI